MKNIQKTNLAICCCCCCCCFFLGGGGGGGGGEGDLKLRGRNFPPPPLKALKKHWLHKFLILDHDLVPHFTASLLLSGPLADINSSIQPV